MKNVLLLGDSIRIGYDKAVRKTLEGRANVFFPEDNCRFAAYLLRTVHEYKSLIPEGDVDVLHWNAGLWDCLRLFGEDPHTPIDIYTYYIDRICTRIGKAYPNAKVIFATSTQVISEKMDPDFKRYNEEIEAYNQAAAEIVTRHGFAVNDLYAASAPCPRKRIPTQCTTIPPWAPRPSPIRCFRTCCLRWASKKSSNTAKRCIPTTRSAYNHLPPVRLFEKGCPS